MNLNSPAFATIKTGLVVTIVSVLIWIVAEGESLSSERLEVRLALVAGRDTTRVIEPESGVGWTGRVFVVLDGSTAAISRLGDRLREGLRVEPGDPGVPSEPGIHDLDLAEVVRQSAALEGTAVSVRSIEPERLTVVIEELATMEIEVAVALPDEAQASAVVADPRRVRLTYPTSAADLVAAGVVASARLSADQVSSLSVGTRSTVRDVALALPDGLAGGRFVRLEPSTVSVIATLDTRNETVTLDTVPVQIQRPAFQAERWVVRVNPEDQLLTGVTVTGPAELIEPIRNGSVAVFATVSLTPDDLDRQVTQKEVGFANLPTPLRFESPKRSVRLTIERVPTQ